MNYWLMKSEPDVYGIDDLMAQPDQTDHWDGIRNYQARNFMRDQMKMGDKAFFYHSNCKEPGVVGTMSICREAYTDHTQFDANEKYYDPKSDPDNPRWIMVNLRFEQKFGRTITLKELRGEPALAEMRLLARGNRLSIMPVTKDEWDHIMGMARN